MGIAIVIASGKGGTGKTTCCAAIASFLAAQGAKTLCLDCDIGLRNLDLALGLADDALWDFSDLLAGRVSIEDGPVPHPELENLYFLSAPARLSPSDVDPAAFASLVEELRHVYDYILIDAPAGIGAGFKLAAGAADMAIIVATGDVSSLRDGQRTAEELTRLGVSSLRLLVNRVDRRSFRRVSKTVDDVIDAVGAQLIGIVSEDESVPEAANLEKPLKLYGAKYAYGQFSRVARRIAGERVPLGKI